MNMAKTKGKGAPTMVPPNSEAQGESTAVGLSEPKPLTDSELVMAGAAAATEASPTMLPPGAEGAAIGEAITAVTGTWRTGVTVTALWSINETRNAWMHVAGIGWKKIYNGRDGAFTALVTLASQARQTGRAINFREEADGMVYEIYLW